VAAPGELWALRYPAQHALHIIERPAGPSSPPTASPGSAETGSGLHARSSMSSYHAPGLQALPSVVVASEELDGERGWRMLAPGELVHVRPDLAVEAGVVITEPPARLVPLPAGNPNTDT
jgi:predicted glutamine amidotransferase